MDSYSIYQATSNDARIVAELIGELLTDFNLKSGSNFIIDISKIETTCIKLLTRDNFGAFIAMDCMSKQPVGLITIAQATAIYNGGDFGVITELYVDRNIRSNGIGKLLLNRAFEFAKANNWEKVEDGAPNKEDWPRTIKFYKNNGFEEKGPKLRITI